MDRAEIYQQLKAIWSKCQETGPSIEANRDYWTDPDITAAEIRTKHNLKKWKPMQVRLSITCPDCGQQDELVLQYKKDVVSRGESWKCPHKNCPGHEIRMPFGKYRGMTVAEVCRKQPSYLAWFLEAVESDCEEVRMVKAQIEKLPVVNWLLEKYHERQLQQPWTGHIRLSAGSLDDLCDRLFNGE